MTEDIKFEDMQPPKDAYPDLTDEEIKARDKSWKVFWGGPESWQQKFDNKFVFPDGFVDCDADEVKQFIQSLREEVKSDYEWNLELEIDKARLEGISQGREEGRDFDKHIRIARIEELTRIKGIIKEMKSQKKYDKEKDSIARGFEIDGWNLALRTLESKLGENSK